MLGRNVWLAPQVAEVLPNELVERIRTTDAMWCARCSRLIELSEPIVVAVYRDSRANVTCLVHLHVRCGSSEVIETDLAAAAKRMTEQVSLTALLRPQRTPALLVCAQSPTIVADNGELVDVAIARMLELGLHLVTDIMANLPEPGRAGWRTRICPMTSGGFSVMITDAGNQQLVADGTIQASARWSAALGDRLPLYVTTAPFSGESALGTELASAARAGRLVGASVPITLADTGRVSR